MPFASAAASLEIVDWRLDASHDPTAFETYRAGVSSLFDVTLLSDPAAFRNHLHGYNLGEAAYGRCRGVAQRFERTPAHIRRSGVDTVMIILSVRGDWSGDYGGRQVHGADGSIRLVDMARPFDVVSGDFDMFTMVIPRDMVAAPLIDRLHGTVITDALAGGAMLRNHLTTLWDVVDTLTPIDAQAGVQVAATLIASAFDGQAGDVAARPAEQTILSHARAYIDAHLADETLGPETLRAHLGVSRAVLYRMFEPSGGVAVFIRNRRLDHAFDAIVTAGAARISVSQIAHRTGFRSDAHFSRVFTARFGLRPSDLRGASAAGVSRAPSATRDDVGTVIAWLQALG